MATQLHTPIRASDSWDVMQHQKKPGGAPGLSRLACSLRLASTAQAEIREAKTEQRERAGFRNLERQ